MPPYVTRYTKSRPIMDDGKPAHPLEDPLNWPEQREFGRLFETLARWNKRLTTWRATRTDAKQSGHRRRVGIFEH